MLLCLLYVSSGPACLRMCKSWLVEFGFHHFVWPNVKRDPKVVSSSLAPTGRDSNRSCLIRFDFPLVGQTKFLFDFDLIFFIARIFGKQIYLQVRVEIVYFLWFLG